MDLAKLLAQCFSKDPNSKVGCVILSQDMATLLSIGVNSFPDGVDDTPSQRWTRPVKYNFVVHAEQNAIAKAARFGTPLQGSTSVQTMFPCINCAKAMIQAGIRCVLVPRPLDNDKWAGEWLFARSLLDEAGVTIQFVE